MKDVHTFYYTGREKGLWRWNGGEGTKLLTECRRINQNAPPDPADTDVARIAGRKLDWGGCSGCLTFDAGGILTTSWGKGRWGKASTPSFPNVIFASFVNVVHLLKFQPSGQFLSTRCSDGEELRGSLIN